MSNKMDPKYEYEVAASIYPEPLALFEKDPDWKPMPFNDHRCALGGIASFVSTRVVALYFNRRPLYSGLQKTVAYGIIGAIVGEVIQIGVKKYVDFRSQVHRHYIMLHPERFPPPEKIKYGDRFDLWMPSR